MYLKDMLKKGINILKNTGIETPEIDAGVILCRVLDCDRTFIYAHGDNIISDSDNNLYMEFIDRRVRREPLQYITGWQEFMSLEFSVRPGVLIPRQDTETLVEAVMDYVVKNSNKNLNTLPGSEIRILDMCTGSGCIAVSLAYYIHNCLVTAADLSDIALETAKQNAVLNGVEKKIEFTSGNLFEALNNICCKFDIIVSNPPYITENEIPLLKSEIKDYEPITALNGGNDGLSFYRTITRDSVQYLKKDGILAFEVGYNQAGDVIRLMSGFGFRTWTVRDLSGIDRVVLGREG